MEKILHITHNDLDGAGCGIIVKNIHSSAEIKHLDYKEVDDYILRNYKDYNQIIITDVTPRKETIELLSKNSKLLVFDHHKTSTHLINKDYAIIDMTKCATLLTYEWALKIDKAIERYCDFVRLVNDYDLWNKEFPESEDLNILFTTLGIERFTERFLKNSDVKFTESELLLINVEKDNLKKALEDALNNNRIYKDKWDNTFCLTFTEHYNSEIGDYLLNTLKVNYVLMINAKKSKVSLRSKGDFDVSKIALTFEGGGHKNAAGFTLDFFQSAECTFKKIGLIN
jgi:oligoribonuclease NrnB/cAMP/cGMP phosphodiesterase (DHH superfamily)